MHVGLASLVDASLQAHVEESRAFYAARAASAGSDLRPDPSTEEGLRQARALEKARAGSSSSAEPVEAVAEAAGRRVPVRIFAPETGTARGVYLDIHGGGFYMGLAARGDAHNRHLADALGVAVVSVDYRLAPEHPWPAAPEDCETAALWLVEQAGARFGTARLAIGGISAGATLAMTTLLRLRARGLGTAFAGAALQFGTYDMSGQTPAGRLLDGEFFIQAYAGAAPDRTDPDISPIYGDLRGLPPVLLVVGSLDILLEDNLVMAARLAAAGGDVDVRVYPESPHGFTLHPTAMARTAVSDIESWLADRFGPTTPRVGMGMSIATKRAYEPASPDDGYRVLIDRLWPRGVAKADARIDGWAHELAPSDELRRWFGHQPERFDDFRRRYIEELRRHEDAVAELQRRARAGKVTLVYAARDSEHSNAAVLAPIIRDGFPQA